MRKSIYLFYFLMIFCLSFGWASNKSKPMSKKIEVYLAPEFSFIDITNRSFKLSDFQNKVVILDFFATWCPPCKAEIKGFNEIYSKYKKLGLEIIGISLDDGDKVVKKFAEDYKINYLLTMGNDDLIKLYGGISGIPTTFIIDKKGNIVEKHIGFTEQSVFENAVKKLL